jgi:hypothetical protein
MGDYSRPQSYCFCGLRTCSITGDLLVESPLKQQSRLPVTYRECDTSLSQLSRGSEDSIDIWCRSDNLDALLVQARGTVNVLK